MDGWMDGWIVGGRGWRKEDCCVIATGVMVSMDWMVGSSLACGLCRHRC